MAYACQLLASYLPLRFISYFLFPQYICNRITRPVFDLIEDFADIFTYYSDSHQNQTAESPHRQHQRCPSGADMVAYHQRHENIYCHQYVDEQQCQPC